MSEERLSRIEVKLDKMSEAITLLARMEERMVTLFKRNDKYDEILGKLVERIETVENDMIQRGVVSNFLTKLFWLITGAVIAALIKFWSMT